MKTLKEIQEASGQLVDNIMAPADLRNVKETARQMSSSFQSTVPNIIQKIEKELNNFGYTLGEIDFDEPFEDDGEEDFFVIGVANKEIIKNVYISVEWKSLASPLSSDIRADGPVMNLTATITVNEVTPAEMSVLIANSLDDGSDDLLPDDEFIGDEDMAESAADENAPFDGSHEAPERSEKDTMKSVKKLARKAAKAPVKNQNHRPFGHRWPLGEEALDESFQIKKVNRNLEIHLAEEKLDFNVHTDGSLVLELFAPGNNEDSPVSVTIPRNKALQVMNALMDHFVAFQK